MDNPTCSFCSKPADEVEHLCVTRSGVGICTSCIDTCRDIVGSLRARALYKTSIVDEYRAGQVAP